MKSDESKLPAVRSIAWLDDLVTLEVRSYKFQGPKRDKVGDVCAKLVTPWQPLAARFVVLRSEGDSNDIATLLQGDRKMLQIARRGETVSPKLM
ncbi:MAG: hypothetical protein QOI07_2412 [Verrucomicrobiota bacterium]